MAKVRKRTWTTPSGEQRQAWACDWTDGSGSRQRKQFPTSREANAFRIDLEGKIASGTYRPEASKVTVQFAAEAFLKHCLGRWERHERMTWKTFDTYEGQILNYVCPDPSRHADKKRPKKLKAFSAGIGDIKLAQLTPPVIGEFRDRLRSAGVSVVTTRRILSTLHGVLAFAIGKGWVATNAAHGVKVIAPKGKGAKKVVPPSKDALRLILGEAGEDLRIKITFAAASGVRAGEFHALRWRHLDLSTGEATIETRVDAFGDEDVTKTDAGMRVVPLGADIVKMMKAWKLRSKFSKPDDLVFPNPTGKYEDHGHLVKRCLYPLFTSLAAKHNADPIRCPKPPTRFGWHALRHFAISTWIEADLKPKVVQELAGHADLNTTMNRYGHMFKSDDHKLAMDRIAAGLFG
ncbi:MULTISPECIES: site-specific integrase [unclassified Inquilinus]|uniref:site-specific integrase n=1 Tax=unclassified Inquilinus TaxID=2645927 RepID=UPI003F90A761